MKEIYLFFLLCLWQALPLNAQIYPINSTEGWGLIDGDGRWVQAIHPQTLMLETDRAYYPGRTIFERDSSLALYKETANGLGIQKIDSFYLGREYWQSPLSSRTDLLISWSIAYKKGVLPLDELRNKEEKERAKPDLNPILFCVDSSYYLYDQYGQLLYEGDNKPQIIQKAPHAFVIEAGVKRGIWISQPRRFLPVQYLELDYYPANSLGPACLSLKVAEAYKVYSGSQLEDSLLGASMMRHLTEDRLAVKDTIRSAWGVLDKFGDTIVPTKYDLAFNFRSDHTLVYREDNVGLVDLTGKEIFPPDYNAFVLDPNGCYWVMKQNKWALADSNGSLLTPLLFSRPGSFQGPVALVRVKKRWGLINQFGAILAQPRYDAIQLLEGVARLKSNDKITQVSFTNEGRFDPRKRIIMAGAPPIKTIDSTKVLQHFELDNEWFSYKKKWGVKRASGQIILKPTFDYRKSLPQLPFDLVYVQLTKDGRNLRYGLYDLENARTVLKPSLAHIRLDDFDDMNVARAILPNGYYVLLNRKGAIKNLKKISHISDFENGVAVACYNAHPRSINSNRRWITEGDPFKGVPIYGGKWGLLNQKGEWLLKPTFQTIQDYEQGRAIAMRDYKWGTIDPNGNTMVPFTYDSLYRPISSIPDQVAKWYCSVQRQKRYFFFDQSGQIQFIRDLQSVAPYQDAFTIASSEYKFGVLDRSGNWQITPKYEDLGIIAEDRIPFSASRKWGYLNLLGDTIVAPHYTKTSAFSEGRAAVLMGKRWGYINAEGELIRKIKYQKAEAYQDGRAIVKHKGRFGLLNLEGKWDLKPKYYKIIRLEEGFAIYRKGDKTHLNFNEKNRKSFRPLADSLLNTDDIAEERSIPAPTENYHYFDFDTFTSDQGEMQYGIYGQLIGLIDESGKQILPMDFEEIRFVDGLYWVVWHGKLGYYSPHGHWVRKPEGYK